MKTDIRELYCHSVFLFSFSLYFRSINLFICLLTYLFIKFIYIYFFFFYLFNPVYSVLSATLSWVFSSACFVGLF